MASEAFFVVVVVAAAAAVVLANALPVRSERGGVEKDEVNIWPMPAWVSHGRGHLYMSNDFVLSTEGSGYGDASGILKDAFHRMLAVIKLDHVVDANFSALHDQPLLQGLRIVISSPKDQVPPSLSFIIIYFYCLHPLFPRKMITSPLTHYPFLGFLFCAFC